MKRRYRKWPRIGHLDICNPSYGQKKGRESNWQFDSRPLKAGNRLLPDLRIESAIRRWKDLAEGYKFGLDFVVRSYELPKSRDSTRDSFGTISRLQPGSPGVKVTFGRGCRGVSHNILWGVRWWLTPESGPWCVSWSKVPVACPNTQGCPEC